MTPACPPLRPLPSALRVRPAAPRARTLGFTLVELVMVIMLLGILSFVATARMSDTAAVKAQGFAQQAASTLRLAHKTAVAQRRTIHVQIDSGGGRVRVCLDAGCAAAVTTTTGEPLQAVAPAGVTLASATAGFSFDARGRPVPDVDVTLTATGGALNVALRVERDSGYVHQP